MEPKNPDTLWLKRKRWFAAILIAGDINQSTFPPINSGSKTATSSPSKGPSVESRFHDAGPFKFRVIQQSSVGESLLKPSVKGAVKGLHSVLNTNGPAQSLNSPSPQFALT
ncbi:hypothetical protein D3C87_289900 [compost metagenome]